MQKRKLKIEDVKPFPGNPRKISEKAVASVKASIEQFGYNSPIIVDKDKFIIMGHTRRQALVELGHKMVEVLVADHLTEQQARELRVIDNRVGEMSTWDKDLLRDELRAVGAAGEMNAFFGEDELNSLLGALDEVPDGASPSQAEIDSKTAASESHYAEESTRKAESQLTICCPECEEKFFIDARLAAP